MKEKIQFDQVRDFGQLISTTLTYSFRNLRGLTKAFLYLVLPALGHRFIMHGVGLSTDFTTREWY